MDTLVQTLWILNTVVNETNLSNRKHVIDIYLLSNFKYNLVLICFTAAYMYVVKVTIWFRSIANYMYMH